MFVNSNVTEKKHTPIYVDRTHGPYDSSGLISWSPYRASDETALISLPNAQVRIVWSKTKDAAIISC